ncbi:hypothetical protein [Variovorax sp. IB41]|uniref:hypothetical protein n=1 Tax=Variovorax sp. IB41 TaxID=2779370 RepID=UPI0018E8D578|nr:hypothetical protein [Variovorax sp. IB41]MBJ2154580.1 hypothetical protein [Variovorax sp. IB41]
MTTFAHCRACGQSLHTRAAVCPYCGAPQQQVVAASPSAGSPALGIVSCVLGVLMLLAVLTDGFPSDRDELLGAFGLTLTAVICAGLSTYHQKPGRIAAAVGLVAAGIGLLICIANL